MNLSSRVWYAARTLESACFLAQGSPEQATVDTILRRAMEMLDHVWQYEVKLNIVVDPDPKHQKLLAAAYWDAVASQLSPGVVYTFLAVHGEEVNPTGTHDVHITVQPAKVAEKYVIVLRCP